MVAASATMLSNSSSGGVSMIPYANSASNLFFSIREEEGFFIVITSILVFRSRLGVQRKDNLPDPKVAVVMTFV